MGILERKYVRNWQTKCQLNLSYAGYTYSLVDTQAYQDTREKKFVTIKYCMHI